MLDAAEALLADGGSDAVRVQRVARAVGVTDAAVHYHFASREQLLTALLNRTGHRLRELLAARLERPASLSIPGMARDLHAVYAGEGYARLTAWMLLGGFESQGSDMLRDIGARLHAQRADDGAPIEDTLAVVALLNLVTWAEPLAGGEWRRAAGLTSMSSEQFVDWVARLIVEHVEP